MEFVQRGGRGQTPNPNPNFGSIKKHFGDGLRWLVSIFRNQTLLGGVGGGINKKFGQNQYFFLTILRNFPNFQRNLLKK